MKEYPLLGISETAIAVVMDMIYEMKGVTAFSIFPNLSENVQIQQNNRLYSSKIKTLKDLPKDIERCFFGAGSALVRKAIFDFYFKEFGISGEQYDQLLHDKAYISPTATIANGVLVEPHTTVSAESTIDFGTYVKRGALVGHHNQIGKFVDLNPGVVLSGRISIGDNTVIGSGAVLRDNISIGSNTIIGLGSVVTKNIPDNVVAFGNPCKVIKENNSN